MELHLEPGAVIRFLNDPAAFPLQECQYEGRISHRPKPCLSAFNAENVALTGSGVLDGCGAPWWAAQRARTLANGRPCCILKTSPTCASAACSCATARRGPSIR